jgi:hypothetical protein
MFDLRYKFNEIKNKLYSTGKEIKDYVVGDKSIKTLKFLSPEEKEILIKNKDLFKVLPYPSQTILSEFKRRFVNILGFGKYIIEKTQEEKISSLLEEEEKLKKIQTTKERSKDE